MFFHVLASEICSGPYFTNKMFSPYNSSTMIILTLTCGYNIFSTVPVDVCTWWHTSRYTHALTVNYCFYNVNVYTWKNWKFISMYIHKQSLSWIFLPWLQHTQLESVIIFSARTILYALLWWKILLHTKRLVLPYNYGLPYSI